MDKKLKAISANIEGLFVITPNIFSDDRGTFSRVYCQYELESITKILIRQVNHSTTKKKGTVRGLHFQYGPNAEAKMVKCIKGSVFDVVVDIRKGSPTFLESFTIELTVANQKMIYIPKGFAHGFQTLEDNTELLYFHSNVYAPENETALNVKDPQLDIQWPLEIMNLSKRDSEHKFLDDGFEGIKVYEL